MNDHDIYDVLVVGAGPAGLAASLVLGRQQRRVLLADTGAPRNAPVHAMHMYLGFDGVDPANLRARAREEISAHPNVTILSASVTQLRPDGATFEAVVGGRRVAARAVLLATGVRDAVEDLPGLAERWGRDVVHCAYCHGYESKGRSIAVLPLSPVDAVLARYVADRFGGDVTLFTDRIAGSEVIDVAAAGGVRLDDRPVVSLSGGTGDVQLTLADGATAAAEVVFHRPRTEPTCPLAADLGCELNDAGLVLVSATQETSVPGVFAAGDGSARRDDPAPLDFVLAAAADGQRAAVWIEQRLFAAAVSPAD